MNSTISTGVKAPPPHAQALAVSTEIEFRGKVALAIAVWGMMSLAATFHWFGTSLDYFNYLAFYDGLPEDISRWASRFEGGFVLSAWIYKYVLGTEYTAFSISVISISLAIKFYLFFRYLKSPLLAIFAYLAIFFPLYEYTQIRAAMGGSLIYLAIHCYLDRKYYLSFASFVGAIAFHSSAAIVAGIAIAFFVVRRPIGVAAAFVGILAFAFWYDSISTAMTGLLPLINPFSKQYLDNTTSSALPNVFSVQNIFLVSSVLSTYFVIAKSKTNYDTLLIFLSVTGMLVLITFEASPVLAQRGKELLTVSAIFLVFRGPIDTRLAPFVLMFVCGSWSLYRAFSEGVFGG